LEKASYPDDEAASTRQLQYRQHHAAKYFRCAVLPHTVDAPDPDHDPIIGFVCSTRCRTFTSADAMSTHVPHGLLLAIHSVVVHPDYRRQGVATALLRDYVLKMAQRNLTECNATSASTTSSSSNSTHVPIQKIVLLSKPHLWLLYVNCGFRVIRPSPIRHGKETWYELEYPLPLSSSSSTSSQAYWVLDAFADQGRRGTGNPAAVVPLEASRLSTDADDEAGAQWMQLVAQEFNLSETAFVWPYNTTSPSTTLKKKSSDGGADYQSKEWMQANEWHYHIRYFTPRIEVPLCGHATLASAATLYQTLDEHMKHKNETTLVFHTRSGDMLKARLASWGHMHVKITMEFPSHGVVELALNNNDTTNNDNGNNVAIGSDKDGKDNDKDSPPSPTKSDLNNPAEKNHNVSNGGSNTKDSNPRQEALHMLQTALGIREEHVLFLGVSPTMGDLLVEVSYDALQSIPYDTLPNMNALTEWNGYSRGVIVCSQCTADEVLTDDEEEEDEEGEGATSTSPPPVHPDFVSRFFAPKAGIPEDPVTGSAHCILAPYFGAKLDKKHVWGHQISQRGGLVECHLLESPPRVRITGSVVTTMQGTLNL
jgi:predicted PhzF superfamily epimerase YddE/YHI9/GNAT superfamily N-acetyltransferase